VSQTKSQASEDTGTVVLPKMLEHRPDNERLNAIESTATNGEMPIPKTLDKMIIHHADRLHKRIANRGADKVEATPFQIFAHGI